jgi:PAS domain S-box-containing protein
MIKKFNLWIHSSLRRHYTFSIVHVMVMLLILFGLIANYSIRYSYENTYKEKGKMMAMNGASSIEQVFENAIRNGIITEEELFDTNYQLIENTDPPKYHTAYDRFTDESIILIQESYRRNPDVTAAVAVDINGYLPTHNILNAQPLTGDYQTDLIGNRTKRIFNDETGLISAQNTEPYLQQVYYRDTGEVMWDISAPIYVNGRHWGAFRVGLSLENLIHETNKLMWWIILIAVSISLIMLIISFLVTKPIEYISILSEYAEKISKGDLSSKISLNRSDEIGLLADSLNMIIDSEQRLAQGAANIAEGDFSTNIIERSEKDVVSKAFSKMVENLQESHNSLSKERNLLQTLLDNSVDAIYFKDLESKFIRISKSQAARFGLEDVNDAIGKSDFDFFAKEYAQLAYEDEQEIVRTGNPILYKEEEEIWLNKESNWVISTKLPLYDENKNIVGTFGVSRDITTKKIMEDLLHAEKEILCTTLMSISEGVIATDSEGLITFLNKRAAELIEFSSDESLDQPLHTILSILDTRSEQLHDNVIQLLYDIEKARKQFIRYTTPTIVSKTGKKLLVNTSISSVYSKKGEVVGHVIVFDDITDLQEKETQTALSQKMESIGQMASGIAHEINTPIQYVGDNLHYLQRAFTKVIDIFEIQRSQLDNLKHNHSDTDEETSGVSPADLKKIDWYIDEVPVSIADALAGVERVRKIVLAMREFSHPSGNDKTFSDINNGIETTVTISRNEWKYVADMELQLAENLPLVSCYMDEINQVVLNMIVNAAHAIRDVVENNPEEKGKITIKTEHTEQTVLIYISDTGTGIPKNIRDRVFDPFFTTKGVGKGTGQGLFLAHNIIVNKHGGLITIESEEGKGTTFIIEIPIGEEGEGTNGSNEA